MGLRLLVVLIIVGLYLFVPAIGLAATAQVIVITASPLLGNECVTNLVMEFNLPDEVSFSWTPAQVTTGTKIVMTVGDWPSDCDDELVVYSGNGTSTTQSIDTDDLVIGLYYHVYNLALDGNCSNCYATGSVIASDAIDTGGTGTITFDTSGLDDMAGLMRVGFVLGFPAIIGIIGAFRHSLGAYLVGIVGMGVSLAYVNDELGIYLTMPVLILITALLFGAILDAWHERIVII